MATLDVTTSRDTSFEANFALLYPRAFALAYRMLGNRTAAEDIAAETMARALLRWDRLDPDRVPGWVLRVAANQAIDLMRRKGRTLEVGVVDLEDSTTLRLALADALRKLPRRQREAVALRYLSDLSEAEDVTQEAFVKAFRSLRRFEDGRPLRPWLMQIVANEARNRRRSRGRWERLAVRAASVGGGPSGSAEDLALGEVTAGEVRAALARLHDRDRTVIALRYFAGLSEAETAAALGISAGSVKSHVHRGLASLKADLGHDTLEAAGAGSL